MPGDNPVFEFHLPVRNERPFRARYGEMSVTGDSVHANR
jgi:hypothetical protein